MRTVMTDPEQTQTGRSMAVRATIASTCGSAVEWIDFTAYGAVSATVFPKIFFASMRGDAAVLASLGTFAVGFFARPLGGLLFGILGDRIGRKNILLYTLTLMGMASFLIGCLPSYATIGIAAPALLVVLRFLQGVALGGESTGAQLLTMEHAPSDRRGLFGAFINIGNSLSAALANGVLFGLTVVLGTEQFENWGWRIPFISSLLLVVIGLYVRRHVAESPAFERAQAAVEVTKSSWLQMVRGQYRTILRLLVAWCGLTASFYVITVYSLTYVVNTLGLPSRDVFLCLMAANVIAVGIIIGGGALSDRIGRKPVMLMSCILGLVMAFAYFPMLNTANIWIIFLAMTLFLGVLQIQSGVQPAYFSEPFPTNVRYSGSALAYTGANLVAGGPTPFIAAWLLRWANGGTWVLTLFCMFVIGCSTLAYLTGPETRGTDLNR